MNDVPVAFSTNGAVRNAVRPRGGSEAIVRWKYACRSWRMCIAPGAVHNCICNFGGRRS